MSSRSMKQVPCANEKNETQTWQNVFEIVSWTHGDGVLVVAQKSLFGRSEDGSAAWQMAGLLQTVVTVIVPGNRNSE